MAEQQDKLLTQQEVVQWTGMSSAWFEQCRFKGTGIPYVKIGRAVRYRTSDVQNWIDQRVISTGVYRNNNMLPEARALFEGLSVRELSKEALLAYAEIQLKDGNISLAFFILNLADEKDGYVQDYAGLRSEIEAALIREVEPTFMEASAALDRNEVETAESLCRNVLHAYSKFKPAKELLSFIAGLKLENEIDNLWCSLQNCDCTDRLDILEKLQEMDKGNREKIRILIEDEKYKIKKEVISKNIARLEMLVCEGNLAEAFDVTTGLIQQSEYDHLFRHIFSLSPFLNLLQNNRHLQRLGPMKGKSLWLSYIEAHKKIEKGIFEGSLQVLEKFKPIFHGYQHFKNDFSAALSFEQNKARDLLKILVEKIEDNDCDVKEAEKLLQEMKQCTIYLPPLERENIIEIGKNRLTELKPQTPEEILLEEYHASLLLGNQVKANLLKKSIGNKNAIGMIDSDIKEQFFITVENIKFTISPSLVVDLVSEQKGYEVFARTNEEIFLRENDISIVRVCLKKQQATRYTSPILSDLIYVDCLPTKDIYLFQTPNRDSLKVYLGEEEARVLSSFVIEDRVVDLNYEKGEYILERYLSWDRDSDVYCLSVTDAYDGKIQIRFFKQDVYKKFLKHHFIKEIDEHNIFHLMRLSCDPDRFILSVDSDNYTLNKQLELMAQVLDGDCIGYDFTGHTAYFYRLEDVLVYDLTTLQLKLQIKDFFDDWFYFEDIIGINIDNKIALLRGGRFYKYPGFISNQVNLKNILCCKTPSDFYFYKYLPSDNEIKVRFLNNLDDFVEWTART